MEDDKKPQNSVEPSTDQNDSEMPFKPAANPFESSESEQSHAAAPEPKQKSAFNLGFGKKKEEEPTKTTETTINGKQTTMVGHTAKESEKKAEKPAVPEEILFSWKAPEFAYTKKPFGWFVILGLFVLVMIGIAIWTQQWLTIVLLIVMGVAIGIWANRKPRELEYKLSNYGVYVENKKYLFDGFRAYYTFMDYTQKTLDLVPTKRFGTLVSLPLAGIESELVEQTIGHMIPRIEHREDWIDKIVRKLRF